MPNVQTKSGILQIDPGWYQLINKNGNEVAQQVVVGTRPNTTEYYYLYTGNTPSGDVWIWPGANTTPVQVTWKYLGSTPSNWDPKNPKAYGSTLPATVLFITATCVSSLAAKKGAKKGAARGAKKGKAKKRGR